MAFGTWGTSVAAPKGYTGLSQLWGQLEQRGGRGQSPLPWGCWHRCAQPALAVAPWISSPVPWDWAAEQDSAQAPGPGGTWGRGTNSPGW